MLTRLILLVILGIVVAFYFPDSRVMMLDKLAPVLDPALEWQTKGEMEQIARDLQTHERENYGRLPGRREWVGWLNANYTTGEAITDAWGSAYQLVVQRDSFAIVSNGPDRIFGTADDVLMQRRLARPQGR